jgi:hypothetical protein
VEGRQPALGLLGGDDGMRGVRHAARVLVAVVALAGAAACSSGDDGADEPTAAGSTSSAPSATPTPAPPPPPAPSAGACYRVSYDEALAPTNSEPALDCAKPHTSQTYATGELDLVAGGHLLAVDSEAARRQVARRCPAKLAAYVGATPEQLRLSLLRAVWFTPTIEESDAGAAWYRCDAIAVTGDQSVAKFTGDLKGAFKRPAGDEFAMCGTAQPGSPGFTRVLCRDDHAWKAIAVVDLTAEAKGPAKKPAYPGEKVVRAAGEDTCQEAARAIASDALDYEWGYEWPTAEQWKAGQTYGRCWAPDPA